MAKPGTRPSPRRAPRPLDRAGLRDLALGYAARYATTSAKLAHYLQRKLRERGWPDEETPPDVEGLVQECVRLGYVDDRAFADARKRSLIGRGFGQERVRSALFSAGLGREDVSELAGLDEDEQLRAALRWAERKRAGPFAPEPASPDTVRRQFAAMLRAGHSPGMARKVLIEGPESIPPPKNR